MLTCQNHFFFSSGSFTFLNWLPDGDFGGIEREYSAAESIPLWYSSASECKGKAKEKEKAAAAEEGD